jgi:hypothetical protein
LVLLDLVVKAVPLDPLDLKETEALMVHQDHKETEDLEVVQDQKGQKVKKEI